MARKNGSFAARASRLTGRRTARWIADAAGRRRAVGAGRSELESLERRVLLGADIPGLPDPWNLGTAQAGAEVITLDPTTGEGESDSAIGVAGDDDLFQFVAPDDDFVRVLADTLPWGSTLNSAVEVYDATGTLVVSGLNNGLLSTGIAPDGWAGFIATAGEQYFIRVLGESNTTGQYTLRVDAISVETAVVDDEMDPFNGEGYDPNSGNPPGPEMSPILGTIDFRQDDEVFRVVTPTGDLFDSLVTVVAGADQVDLDTHLDIYDATGQRITSDIEAGFLNSAFLTFRGGAGSVFYIRVRSDELGDEMTRPSTGEFNLRFDAAAAPVEIDEVNRRGPADAGGELIDQHGTSLFSFVAQGTGVTIVTARFQLFPHDLEARVFDEDGNLIAFSDDIFGSTDSQMEVHTEGGNRYFVVIDGFPDAAGGLFGLFVEAHHTFDNAIPEGNGFAAVDDHVDTPAPGQRPQWELATPIVFSEPGVYFDANGNPVRDRSWFTTGFSTGRIHQAGDVDLFQFVPPVDLLGTYGGDNDNVGTAIYAGGAFTGAELSDPVPVTSRNLAVWDANDWWFVGAQGPDPIGFQDNPDTAGTAGPEIYTLAVVNIDVGLGTPQPVLIVGGDFILNVPTALGPVPLLNMAVWFFDPFAGAYTWGTLGDVDAPVRAAVEYDPVAFDPDGDGPAEDTDDPGGPFLVIGGAFTDVGGTATNGLAAIDLVTLGGWIDISTGIDAGGQVNALAVFDPEDPGDGRDAAAGPPVLQEVPDPADPPPTLYVGGAFTATLPDQFGNNRDVTNIAAWNGAELVAVSYGSSTTPMTPATLPAASVNGPIHAMTVYDATIDDGMGGTATQQRLVIGGEFTNAGGVAATNIAMFGRIDDTQDEEAPIYSPALLWDDMTGGMGGGPNGPVFALAQWLPPEIPGGGTPIPLLVLGGDFDTVPGGAAENIAITDGAAFGPLGAGFDAPVRALTVIVDAQEQGIPPVPNVADDREVVFAAGDFENILTAPAPTPVGHVAYFDVRLTPFGYAFSWFTTREGVDGPVYALAVFDDESGTFDNAENAWDRHDRPSARATLQLSGTFGAFNNMFITIYNSTFDIIYTNDTIAPPFPDPAGAIDPAGAPGTPGALTLAGVEMWAGETYYIEVSSTGSGRYNLALRLDDLPPETDGDGLFVDTISQITEPVDAGMFATARKIQVDANGDGTNYVNAAALPLHGDHIRAYEVTPTFMQVVHAGDLASIERVNDTDLYYFIAPASGTAEVRIATTGLADEFTEQISDLIAGTTEETMRTRTYNSPLDSALRIFNNDFEEIAFNNDNFAHAGLTDVASASTGRGEARTFYERDARVVFNVVQGEKYFVQIESGQLETFLTDPTLVDWRFATGSYELFINSTPGLAAQDDHPNTPTASPAVATTIPISDGTDGGVNGSGSITGRIRDVSPLNPDDNDAFRFTTVGTGDVSIVVIPTQNLPSDPLLALDVRVFDENGFAILARLGAVGAAVTLEFFAFKGDQYFIRVDGAGGTQGAYSLDITSGQAADDHADLGEWLDATAMTINPFLGNATKTGLIEFTGDVDLFTFTAPQYDLAQVSVISNTPGTLDPFVRVYEINEDGAGNPVLMQIAFNNNGRDANGVPLDIDSVAKFSITPGRPYYFLVQGVDPNVDVGEYTIRIDVLPTDDHPNVSDFPLATTIDVEIDPNSGAGLGDESGEIEIPEDDDMFRFVAPATGVTGITVTRTSGDFDPAVSVYDSNLTLLAGPVPDFGTSGNVFLSLNIVAGQVYYVNVDVDTSDDMGATPDLGTVGTYTIELVTAPADDHPNFGDWAIATVITLAPTTGLGTESGVILPNTDTDLFTFVTLAPGDVVIGLTTPESSLNPQIRVFDASFNLIAGSTDDADAATQTVVAAATGERFFILVEADDFEPDAPFQIGSYQLAVLGELPGNGGGGPGTTPDDHADAGEFLLATVINLDTRTADGAATGMIEAIGDSDLFTFTAPSDGPIFVQIVTPLGGLLDARVRIFNAARSQIAVDSNGIPGATASARVTAAGAAQFYVLVEQVGVNLGSYTVKIDADPPTHFLYSPEGFSSSSIDEFVPLVNPNNFGVTFTVWARYETGDRDQLLASGVIGANSRGGITINTTGGGSPVGVRLNTPYALEIQSTGQLGATLSHYDFGITTGENFTNRLSTTWTFSEAKRDAATQRDFLLLYNPNNSTANYTVTLYYTDGTVASFSRSVAALRRSGVNFTTDGAISKNGVFGIKVTSDLGIVASLSRFDLSQQAGYSVLGSPDGGATAGAVPMLVHGGGTTASVSFLNSTDSAATITLRGTYQQVDLPDLSRVITLNPRSRVTMTGSQLGLVDSQALGLRYTSSVKVTVTAAQFRNGDADASLAATEGSQIALIGDAFITPALAGIKYFEDLSIYNPGSVAADVTVTFLFSGGGTASTVVTVSADGFAFVEVDQQPVILNQGQPTAFSIRLDSAVPIAAGFTHYDLFLNGGWGTIASPVGLTNSISSIIG